MALVAFLIAVFAGCGYLRAVCFFVFSLLPIVSLLRGSLMWVVCVVLFDCWDQLGRDDRFALSAWIVSSVHRSHLP